MADSSKAMKLMDLALEGHFTQAKALCDDATCEINTLEKRFDNSFTKSQKEATSEVKRIIKNLNNNQNRAAKAAASSTSAKFYQHIFGVYFKGGLMISQGITQQTDNSKPGGEKVRNAGRETNQQHYSRTYPAGGSIPKDVYTTTSKTGTDPGMHGNYNQQQTEMKNRNVEARGQEDRRLQTDPNDEYYKNQRSKQAGQSLRSNNADIADLSDTNRPTKIAEKFSELYDNEWTEAFESLSYAKRMNEKDIIAVLLKIVEEAYKFCKTEAESQIEKMRSTYFRIIAGETTSTTNNKGASGHEDTGLLVQYRKGLANLALQKLQDQFTGNVKMKYGADMKVVAYANKAVELTWWMAVQDPPVYMCPSKPAHFNSDLYKAYTQSGKNLDHFVWPALKLHEHGGLLMKGVAQYRT